MTDINIGAITEVLNDKTDRDMRNVDNMAGADAIIEYQMPTAQNDYTWYRKYKSGWVEQGCSRAKEQWYTLPIPMADTDYFISLTPARNNADAVYGTNIRTDKMSTTQIFPYYASNTVNGTWEVKGIAAS